MTETLTAALDYAARGWAVFPLNGKVPATARGFKDASTDPEKIREWFGDGARNVGVAIPDGHFVLDVDIRSGGMDTFNRIKGDLPTTLTARTGTGGGHLWFRGEPPTVKLPGIDVKKGGKGYVVAPPSIHPDTGKAYEWSRKKPVAAFDATALGNDTSGDLSSVLGASEAAREAAEGNDPIPLGDQHETLVQIAGHLLAKYPPSIAETVYRKRAEDCDPPHPEDEIDRIWEWVHQRQDEGDGLVSEDDGDEEQGFRRDVERALRDMQVKEEARRLHRQSSSTWSPIEVDSLTDLLRDPPKPDPYRIEGVWLENGTVVFAAEAKAGKTTSVLNLVKSLADGDDFLGEYKVSPPDGNIVVLNVEVSPSQIARWYHNIGIRNTGKVQVINLRGRTGWFGILDANVRQKVADQLRSHNCQILVIDPVGPLWDAEGIEESENTPVGQWLAALTEMAETAGVRELMVIHHFGHAGRRVRGASKLLGWPDALWALLKSDQESDADRSVSEELDREYFSADDGIDRFFAAHGRDVDVSKKLLAYDAKSRALTIDPEGITGRNKAKKAADAERDEKAAIIYIADNEGVNTSGVAKALGWGRERSSTTLYRLLAEARVRKEDGPRNSDLWFTAT